MSPSFEHARSVKHINSVEIQRLRNKGVYDAQERGSVLLIIFLAVERAALSDLIFITTFTLRRPPYLSYN